MNKTILLLPLAFVLGGMAGYVGPNEKLRALRAEVAEKAKAPPPDRRPAGADGFGSFAKLVNIPERAAPRSRPPKAEAPKPAAPAAAESPAVRDGAPDAETAAESRAYDPEDLRARLEKASELWGARADLVRDQTVARLELDAAGAAKFDSALTGMNERLRESMQAIADALAAQEEMTPELGFRLMGDLSATLAETYDVVGEIAGADRRADVSAISLVDFVDPMVAEPLIAVQDKLERAPMGFGPRGGRRR